tara:strand:- start:45 stop:635 length:591 start_codon:yes stop_codon:yes gene_type:complete
MAFATIDVTKGITGTIPVANGGTGLASGTSGQFLKFTGSTTVASSAVDAGKVLQVVNQVYSTEVTRTSTSYGNSGIDATITPSATGSKVLVLMNCGQIGTGNDNDQGITMKLTRSIGAADTDLIAQIHNNAGAFTNLAGSVYRDFTGHASVAYLDSPSSTSACQYRIYFKCRNTNTFAGVQIGSSTSTICLMEIGA